MSVKLSNLKQNKVRVEIKVGDETIIVYNPTLKTKEDLVNFIKNDAEKLESDQVMKYLLARLTNIEMDIEDIVDVMANPSAPMVEVLKHINEIVGEIVYEIMLEQSIALSMLEKSLMGKEIQDKVKAVTTTMEDIKEVVPDIK